MVTCCFSVITFTWKSSTTPINKSKSIRKIDMSIVLSHSNPSRLKLSIAQEFRNGELSDKKKMNMEFLPSEIIFDILSRLPVRSIVNCKCVCKSWLQLVETRGFAKFHLSNSDPGIALAVLSSCEIVEFTDIENHSLQLNAIAKLQFPNSSSNTVIQGSADGLLLLHKIDHEYHKSESLYVCNPITREYIDLYSHHSDNSYFRINTFGFGTSKITGKYKVVMLFHTSPGVRKFECNIYTIGTGSWKSIPCDPLLYYEYCGNNGAFVNGNLHWLAWDTQFSPWISCFDLEIELFTTFSVPLSASGSRTSHKRLCALQGCLCLCLCFDTWKDETEIWLMNEYGVEKSWTKKFVIPRWNDLYVAVPFKVFKNGDILLSCDRFLGEDLFCCYSKNKTIRKIDMPRDAYTPTLHVSSFLSLKSFVMENTISY